MRSGELHLLLAYCYRLLELALCPQRDRQFQVCDHHKVNITSRLTRLGGGKSRPIGSGNVTLESVSIAKRNGGIAAPG